MADDRALNVRGRQWVDPAVALRLLRQYEYLLAASDVPDVIRHLRTGRLKESREARNAALFAQGLSSVVSTKVWVSPGETSDADFLTMVHVAETQVITHWQLKELVPADTNPVTTLHDLMATVAHRPLSTTSLVVYLNRGQSHALETLSSFRVPFAELWYFWCGSEDQSDWYVHGDALKAPRTYRFSYPA